MTERLDDFTLMDGDRQLTFKGVLLGESSSHAPGKLRWSEIAIYRTVGGSYVVAGCGKSRAPGETDRSWAQVCERPQGVIERLNMLDDDGSRYIPRTSLLALADARRADEELDRAFLVQTVD